MNLNPNLEKYTETKIRYLMDPESVKKEKRYKLGEWLHGEYRRKFKKTVHQIDQAHSDHVAFGSANAK